MQPCPVNADPVVVSLRDFAYDKDQKKLSAASELTAGTFPPKLKVISHHTGAAIIFVQDDAAAMRNEFWDGEMMEYIPHLLDQSSCKVDRLVLHHEW